MSTSITRRGDRGLGKTAAGGNNGSFAGHERAAAVAPPAPTDEMHVQIPIDEGGIYWSGYEVGAEELHVHSVNVHANQGSDHVWLEAEVYENAGTALTTEQIERGLAHIEHVFTERYDAEVTTTDDEGVLAVTFSRHLGRCESMSANEASQIISEHFQLSKLANETDRGTFGSPYVYGQLATDIDRGFFPFDRSWEAREAMRHALYPDRQDGAPTEVKPEWDQIQMILDRGYCTDAEKCRVQLDEAAPTSRNVHYARITEQLDAELARQAARPETRTEL